MRFTETRAFSVDDLLLDEGNYRFRGASDQRECIEKIYYSSPDNFRNIMTSIAEDDLGELLLVYLGPDGDNVVLDGNRRTSALKVLANPDFAPTEAVRKRAIELSERFVIQADNVQAQVSSDKNLILKTIYERHGSTGGKSRINWPAMAKSRFGYDHDMEMPEAEWKVIALLYKLEELDPRLTPFFESAEYKHDVFRRIVPVAIRLNLIPNRIYSDRNRSIKRSEKALVNRVARVCESILNDIRDGEIGLSRGKNAGIYADIDGVEEYLGRFLSKEDHEAIEPEGIDQGNDAADDAEHAPVETNQSEPMDEQCEGDNDGTNSTITPPVAPNPSAGVRLGNYGVSESNEVKAAIIRTGSIKFEQLYSSICTVSLNQHPSLVVIGAWCLIEAIGTALGKDAGTPIDSFFSKNHLSNWFPKRFKTAYLSDVRRSLTYLNDEANNIKHSAIYRADNAGNLRAHYDTLELFLIAVLDKIVTDKVPIR